MEYRTLGTTGVSVSRLGLGTMMLGAAGNPDHDDAVRIIRRALHAGVNLVDTADMYSDGESEEIVGKALRGRRDNVVLASKAHHPMGPDVNQRGSSRRWLISAVEDSLRRLGTDYIDLYQTTRCGPHQSCPTRTRVGAGCPTPRPRPEPPTEIPNHLPASKEKPMTLHRVINLVREVPDLATTRAFFTEFGLEETRPGVFASVLGGEQLFLREGPRPRVVEVTVAAETAADIDAVEQRLAGLGVESHRDGEALEAVAPLTEILFRVQVAERLPKDPIHTLPTEIDRDDLVQREPIRPLRLGHVVIGVTDVEQAKHFFIEGLGMRLSDMVIGGPFMRFETDHHNIVLLPAPMPLLHHTAWKVRNVDEIGYGGSRMIDNHPERHAWGLGRHAASANYFWYLKDPAGSFCEYYYSEMDDLADGPYFWDPNPDSEELPIAAWASPPLVPQPLAPQMPEAMPAPVLTEAEFAPVLAEVK